MTVRSFNRVKQTWYWKKVAIFGWEWGRNSAPSEEQKIPCHTIFIKHPTLGNNSVTKFEVTNAGVHCTDGTAGHFVTECLSNIYIFEAIL